MERDDRINYLNIGLIVLSAALAFAVPFPLFLFSYAVLGPLHYLTEISWLHQKGYFTRRRHDYLALGMLAIGIMVVGVGLNRLVDAMQLSQIMNSWGFAILYGAFGGALIFATLQDTVSRIMAFLALALAGVFVRSVTAGQLFFTVFLPTLVHVFVFTGAFMLYGALRSRSVTGLLSCAAFVAAPLLLWAFNDQGRGWILSDPVIQSYFPDDNRQGMGGLYIATIKTFGLGPVHTREDVLYSGYGSLVARFIAFAYTYHYLNWFSKTSVIGWHKVSGPRLAGVVVFWIVSILLYAHDYRLGLKVLYGLSFLHVFLEFPLNHVSFVGIGREMGEIVRTRHFAKPTHA